MAVVVPLQARIDQYKVESAAVIARSDAIIRESDVMLHKGDLLIYEISPCLIGLDFLGRIPMKVVDLIANIAKTILSGVLIVTSLGLNTRAVIEVKHYSRNTIFSLKEIGILFFATFFPRDGIDKLLALRMQRSMS